MSLVISGQGRLGTSDGPNGGDVIDKGDQSCERKGVTTTAHAAQCVALRLEGHVLVSKRLTVPAWVSTLIMRPASMYSS
jgi:hypothetical protein